MMASARTSAPSRRASPSCGIACRRSWSRCPYRTSIAPVSCCRTPHRAHPAVTRPAPARSRRPASARALARRPPPRFRAPCARDDVADAVSGHPLEPRDLVLGHPRFAKPRDQLHPYLYHHVSPPSSRSPTNRISRRRRLLWRQPTSPPPLPQHSPESSLMLTGVPVK